MSTRIVESMQTRLKVSLWAILIALSTFLPSTWAQTPVSGSISADVQWTADQSPFLVSGHLVIENGATLDIAPGVTIFMAPSASLAVDSGSVRAIGTADSVISVVSDNTRIGQPASPGDFGSWTFNAGAVDVHLEHLVFQHGSGLQVRGTSPTFNYLDLRDNAGPAISIDLAASPSGVGNRASGNGINGVDVPAGDVTGSIDWGIRGIPYVVRSGVLSVGRSPTVSSVTPNVLQQGETATVEVTGTRLDGVAEARFGAEDIVVDILPGASATRASLNVTVGPEVELGTTDLALMTDAGDVFAPGALTISRAVPTITSLTPARVFVNQGDAQIEVAGRGFAEESIALLNGAALETDYVGPSRLNATVPGQAEAGELAFQIRTPDSLNPGTFLFSDEVPLPVLPPQIVITPEAIQVVSGLAHTFTLELPYPADAGGLAVALASSDTAVATVPAAVSIAEGERFAQFALTAVADGTATITASHANLISGQSVVTVVSAPALSIAPVDLVLGVGRTVEITVTSNEVAGADGLTVQLVSSDSATVQVTTELLIAAGTNSATATVTAISVGEAMLTASAADFLAATATVRVVSGAVILPDAAVVAPGMSRGIELTLSDPAPAGGLSVTLQSLDPGVATVPSSVHLTQGDTSARFELTGVSAGSTTIVASAHGDEQAILPVTVAPIQLQLGSPAVGNISLPSQLSVTHQVILSQPAPVGGVVVTLTSANPGVVAVEPLVVTIPAGQSSSGAVRVTVNALASGSTTLMLESEGLQATTIPVTVGNQASLHFSTTSEVVGKGLRTGANSIYIQRRLDNDAFGGADAVTVTLTSSDPGKVSVPETVSIPAGQSSIQVPVTGVDLTGGNPVTITASADGYIPPPGPLTITTVTPTVAFEDLDLARGTNSVRDDFRLALSVPGASVPTQAVAATELVFDLAIVNASPAGIVPGIYTAATGGEATTQIVVPSGQRVSNRRYIETPTAMGTYRVRANVPGIADVTSSQITVSDRALRFSQTTEVVGKGLRNNPTSIYVERVANGQPLNGTEALTVTLISSDADSVSVPETVTIQPGQYRASFQVTGLEYTDGVPAAITASAEGHASPVNLLRVTSISPQVQFSGVEATRGLGSTRDDFQVRLIVPGALAPNNAVAATTLTLDLSIADASPVDVVHGFFDALTGGELTTQTVIQAGQQYSAVRYVGTPTAVGSYRIRVDVPGITEGVSNEVVVGSQLLRFTHENEAVGKGLSSSSIRIQRFADGAPLYNAEPLVVTLTSSDPDKVSVPETVTIPTGNYQAIVQITGLEFTDGEGVAISASADGFASPATDLNVTTIAPVVEFNGLEVARTPESPRDDFRVSVSVPGAVSPTGAVAASGLVFDLSVIEASPPGIVPGFYSVLTGGEPISQVTVPAGQRLSGWAYADTPIDVGTYRLHAHASGVADGTSDQVTVANQSLRFNRTNEVVGKGLRSYLYAIEVIREVDGQPIFINQPLTVTLASSDPSKVSVPETVTIAAWNSVAYVQLTGVDFTNEVPVTIIASAEGYAPPVEALAVTVVAPTVTFGGLEQTRGIGGGRDDFRVQIGVTGAAQPWVTAAVPLTFDLSVVDASPEGVVPGFYNAVTGGSLVSQVTIPTGSSESNLAYVGSPTAQGSYRVAASAQGLAEGVSEEVAVHVSSLHFSRTFEVVGKGMISSPSTIFVERRVNGQIWSGATPLTVTLSSGDTGKISVPATVTIPAWSYRAAFSLTGVDLTTDGPVEIDASANGFTSPEYKLSANVVAPQVTFQGVEWVRSVGGARDDFRIQLNVPGAATPASVTAATNMSFDLSTVEATPTDIVPGFYNALTGGNQVTQITVPAGQRISGLAYADSPAAPGSYRVHANAPGVAAASSDLVTVGAASLRFTRTNEVVGKGTETRWSVYVQREVGVGQPLYDAVPLTVTLTSSDPGKVSVPVTVTIPAGSANVTVPVTGIELTDGNSVIIDASADGFLSPATKLSVTSVTPLVRFTYLDTVRRVGLARDDFRIDLEVPGTYGSVAAAQDLVFDLSLVDASPAGIVPGFYRASTGGEAITRTTVLAGRNYSEIAYVGSPTALGTYRVGVTAAGVAQGVSDQVVVGIPALRFNRVSEVVGKGMTSSTWFLQVERVIDGQPFTDGSPLTVTLTSTDPAKVSVQPSLTIGTWSTVGYFALSGIDLTDGGAALIDASAQGYAAPETKLAVSVVNPTANFSSLDLARSTTSDRDSFSVYLTVPDSSEPWAHYPTSALTVDLSIAEPMPPGVVSGFFDNWSAGNEITQVLIRPGSTYSDTAYVAAPSSAGTYRVRAQIPGIVDILSNQVVVEAPSLRFSSPSRVLGKGLTYRWAVEVERIANGQRIYSEEPLQITLTSDDPGKVSVPETVTIPAWSSSTYIELTGVGLTGGIPVTVDAAASGYSSPSTKLQVTTVPPVLWLDSLDDERSPSSAPDDFYVYLDVPGSNSGSGTPFNDIAVDLSVVDASPAGIVPGFYADGEALEPVTQTVIRRGAYSSDVVFVGTPAAEGTYRVRLQGAGLEGFTSSPVNVGPSRRLLRFGQTNEVVGKGMTNGQYSLYVERVAIGQEFDFDEPLTVTLASSDPTKVSVPATVEIPAQDSAVSFQLTGMDFTDGVPVTITASADGHQAPALSVNVNVVAAVVEFYGLDEYRGTNGGWNGFSVNLMVPDAVDPWDATPVNDLTFDLSIVDASPPGIVQQFYNSSGEDITQFVIPAGQNWVDWMYVGPATSEGTYRVRATAPGIADGVSPKVTVDDDQPGGEASIMRASDEVRALGDGNGHELGTGRDIIVKRRPGAPFSILSAKLVRSDVAAFGATRPMPNPPEILAFQRIPGIGTRSATVGQ
ncbi:hypothetical protein LDO26_01210 [Luteimonas sp. BDR2-5]|uniref:hypothetical protein n=1 Tax=Proluteimonas luteida TaxID=2878685 RepID=UPI001E61B221|nr:hypothetical protein [Luteimonas sp. BDR2-5]MCD9026835.1 hypothetical protein [Luteimonas sp. BDR2-5]